MMFFQAVFQFPDIFLPARSSETTFRTMNKILYREGTMKNTVHTRYRITYRHGIPGIAVISFGDSQKMSFFCAFSCIPVL